jgi:phospholipid-translocating ATPase
MVFRECEIGGVIYKGDQSHEKNDLEEAVPVASGLTSESTETSNHSGNPAENGNKETLPKKIISETPLNFASSQLSSDIQSDPDSPHARKIHGFFTNLALCHTVIASEDEEGNLRYKAQSPDEAALVQAAADVGFIFLGREKNILKLQIPGDEEVVEWELLNVLEFTSARKRMSVVVRRLGRKNGENGKRPETEGGDELEGVGRLFLLSKGADSIIFQKLAPGQDEIKKKTDTALEEFANTGLRTLCLAYRDLQEDEYQRWSREYNEASASIEDRDWKIELACDKLEKNLILLGSTAIEDRLQDGVPETIRDLKRAGIKVWVATGDKLETAIGEFCFIF